MEWDRWDKLVTGARTKDTGIVKQYKPSGERWRPRSDGRLGGLRAGSGKICVRLCGGVRMCMKNGVITKLHDHRKELAVAIGAKPSTLPTSLPSMMNSSSTGRCGIETGSGDVD